MTRPVTHIEFDTERDRGGAHTGEKFERVLQIAHLDWHGIRNATGAMPGHKLCIPHDSEIDGESLRHLYGLIFKFDIRSICFQGYSGNAHRIAVDLKKRLGDDISLFVVSHVTSAQFENAFEMEMQTLIQQGLQRQVFKRAGSVKPGFSTVVPGYWPETLINFAPLVSQTSDLPEFDEAAVFIPLENTWRKNLYTNVLAAVATPSVETVYTVNWPTGLDAFADLSSVVGIPYRRGGAFLDTARSVAAMLNATLAECQPMTQLEAFSVGTPCITGQLGIKELSGHPLSRLCEVSSVDNPEAIACLLEQLVTERRVNPAGVSEMISDYLDTRHELAVARYCEFLDL